MNMKCYLVGVYYVFSVWLTTLLTFSFRWRVGFYKSSYIPRFSFRKTCSIQQPLIFHFFWNTLFISVLLKWTNVAVFVILINAQIKVLSSLFFVCKYILSINVCTYMIEIIDIKSHMIQISVVYFRNGRIVVQNNYITHMSYMLFWCLEFVCMQCNTIYIYYLIWKIKTPLYEVIYCKSLPVFLL